MTKTVFVPFVLVILLATLNSCSVFRFAKIYTSSDKKKGMLYGDVYKKGQTSYRIGNLESDWKRLNIDYGDLFFANKNKTAAITVNSSCGTSKVSYSLSALSGSLLIGIKGKKLLERELVKIDNEDALFSVYEAKVDEDQLKIATAVFIRGECVYDFTYTNISDNFNRYLNDFIEFLAKFSVLEG